MFNMSVAMTYELLNKQYNRAIRSKKIELKVGAYIQHIIFLGGLEIGANKGSTSSSSGDFQNRRTCIRRFKSGLSTTN
jgi:hypothetical protein